MEVNASSIQGNVSFGQVAFSYPTRPEAKVLKNISFEIKATTTNNPLKVKISNEKQLEKGNLKHLYLAVYNMVSSEAENGDLPQLLSQIINSIKNIQSKNQFKRNIMSVGYNFEKESNYNRSYSIINENRIYYEVDDTFPSLGIKDLIKLGKNPSIFPKGKPLD